MRFPSLDRVFVAALFGLAGFLMSSPASGQQGNIPTRDMLTPPEGTEINCVLSALQRESVFYVQCTPLYAGVIVTSDAEGVKAGYLICKLFNEIRCPEMVALKLDPGQEPLDVRRPLICTVVGHKQTDNLAFECLQ
jgi:hypothetical protein